MLWRAKRRTSTVPVSHARYAANRQDQGERDGVWAGFAVGSGALGGVAGVLGDVPDGLGGAEAATAGRNPSVFANSASDWSESTSSLTSTPWRSISSTV